MTTATTTAPAATTVPNGGFAATLARDLQAAYNATVTRLAEWADAQQAAAAVAASQQSPALEAVCARLERVEARLQQLAAQQPPRRAATSAPAAWDPYDVRAFSTPAVWPPPVADVEEEGAGAAPTAASPSDLLPADDENAWGAARRMMKKPPTPTPAASSAAPKSSVKPKDGGGEVKGAALPRRRARTHLSGSPIDSSGLWSSGQAAATDLTPVDAPPLTPLNEAYAVPSASTGACAALTPQTTRTPDLTAAGLCPELVPEATRWHVVPIAAAITAQEDRGAESGDAQQQQPEEAVKTAADAAIEAPRDIDGADLEEAEARLASARQVREMMEGIWRELASSSAASPPTGVSDDGVGSTDTTARLTEARQAREQMVALLMAQQKGAGSDGEPWAVIEEIGRQVCRRLMHADRDDDDENADDSEEDESSSAEVADDHAEGPDSGVAPPTTHNGASFTPEA